MNDKTLTYFRKQVKEAFKTGKITGFLGWSKIPTMPGKSRATIATSPDEVDLLTFDSFSRENLVRLICGKTNYLPELPKNKRFGIMVKGCDARSLLANIAESKINRDDLWVVGVKCPGTIDLERLRASLHDDIKLISDDGSKLHIELLDGKKLDIERSDFLDIRCIRCPYPEPLEADLILPDDNHRKPSIDWDTWVEKYLEKPFEERKVYILEQLSRCTMCFACRDACPGCYCNVNCVMDYPKLAEPYLHKNNSLPSILLYHFIHYFHLSDRCTSCGECARACPENIPLNLITDQLANLQKTAFQFEAGTSSQSRPPLQLYKVEEVLGR